MRGSRVCACRCAAAWDDASLPCSTSQTRSAGPRPRRDVGLGGDRPWPATEAVPLAAPKPRSWSRPFPRTPVPHLDTPWPQESPAEGWGGCGLALGPCPQTSRSGNPGRCAYPRSLRFRDSFLELFINIRVVGGDAVSFQRGNPRGRACGGPGGRCLCPAQNHFPNPQGARRQHLREGPRLER